MVSLCSSFTTLKLSFTFINTNRKLTIEISSHNKKPNPNGLGPHGEAMSYSHRGKPPTTIGARELNFRVRYGNGCDLFAIATKPDGENVLSKLDNNVQTSH